jgi:hypothetical protein
MSGDWISPSLAVVFALVLVAVGLFLVALGVTLFFGSRHESEKNSSRVKRRSDLWNGRLEARGDWLPDARVREGMVYSEVDQRVEIQAGLSDEALRRTFGRR